MFFDNPAGEEARSKAQAALNAAMPPVESALQQGVETGKAGEGNEQVALVTTDVPATVNEVNSVLAKEPPRSGQESLHDFIKRTCVWCSRQNDPTLEFLVRSSGIWLHALQYTVQLQDGTTSSFRTSLPSWSQPSGSRLGRVQSTVAEESVAQQQNLYDNCSSS